MTMSMSQIKYPIVFHSVTRTHGRESGPEQIALDVETWSLVIVDVAVGLVLEATGEEEMLVVVVMAAAVSDVHIFLCTYFDKRFTDFILTFCIKEFMIKHATVYRRMDR